MAKPTLPGVPHKPIEVSAGNAYQRAVVAALEPNPVEPRQAPVEDGRHAVGRPDRRRRPELTIVEELADLGFAGQPEPPVKQALQLAEVDAVAARHHGEHGTALEVQHDGLGQPAAGNVRRLRGFAGCRGPGWSIVS